MVDGLIVSIAEPAVPNMQLAQKVYRYEIRAKEGSSSSNMITELKESILADIVEDEMAPFYLTLCKKFEWAEDESFVSPLTERNADTLAKLDSNRTEAKENAGETEVLDAMFAKARYLMRIGNQPLAFVAYDEIAAMEKTSSVKKIDALLEKTRLALFLMDRAAIKECIQAAEAKVESGGDWDRCSTYIV